MGVRNIHEGRRTKMWFCRIRVLLEKEYGLGREKEGSEVDL